MLGERRELEDKWQESDQTTEISIGEDEIAEVAAMWTGIPVAKLAEAVQNPKNHRYSASRGIPNLRLAIATRYKKLFDVDIDPDTYMTQIAAARTFTIYE